MEKTSIFLRCQGSSSQEWTQSKRNSITL